MKHIFKRIVTAVLIAATMSVPLVSMAAETTTVIKEFEVKNKDADYERYHFTPLYVPESVSATASGNAFVVRAEVTKAPDQVQIQYSTDKNFKKNVKTVTRKNKKYVKNSLNYYFVIKDSNDIFYGQTLFTPKNRRANVIHEAKSMKSAVKMVRSSSFISEARKKEKAYDSYKITNVNSPKKYYVRIRSVYHVYGKTRYSSWKTVKVSRPKTNSKTENVPVSTWKKN